MRVHPSQSSSVCCCLLPLLLPPLARHQDAKVQNRYRYAVRVSYPTCTRITLQTTRSADVVILFSWTRSKPATCIFRLTRFIGIPCVAPFVRPLDLTSPTSAAAAAAAAAAHGELNVCTYDLYTTHAIYPHDTTYTPMYAVYVHDEIMVSTSPCSEAPVDKLRTGVDAVHVCIVYVCVLQVHLYIVFVQRSGRRTR